MDNEVVIFVSNTFVAIPTTDDLTIVINGKPTTSNLRESLEFLTETTLDENKPHQFYFWNPTTKLLHLPRHILQTLIRVIKLYGHTLRMVRACRDIEQSSSFSKPYSMKPEFSYRDSQEEWVKFLTNENASMPIRLLDLQTGKGKTLTAIKSIIDLGKKTLVICPAYLFTQWPKVIKQWTDVPNKKIYYIQGRKSILAMDRLIRAKKFRYDIVIASQDTLSAYINHPERYDDKFPQFLTLFDQVRFGVSIVDELHDGFHINTMIDLNLNIPLNIKLTATASRSDKKSKDIFNRCYPSGIRFNFTDFDKYIISVEVGYELPVYSLPINYFNIDKIGYSQIRYEKWLSSRSPLMDMIANSLIDYAINEFYIKPNKESGIKGKCLLYISTTNFAKVLLSNLLKGPLGKSGLKIGTFFSNDKESKLDELDIIISTFGSAGTGKDIPNVRTTICFPSFKSDIIVKQLLGRNRKAKIGNQYAVFLYNAQIPKHLIHKRGRKQILEQVTKEIIETNYRPGGN